MQSSNDFLALPGHELDLAQKVLRDATGAVVHLRPQAFDVLLFLARHAGRVVSKDELMQAVWAGTVVGDDSVVQCIREIRQALRDQDHQIVRTSPKRGYWLAPLGTNGADKAVGNSNGIPATAAAANTATASSSGDSVPSAAPDARLATPSRRRFGIGAATLALGGVAGVSWWTWGGGAAARAKGGAEQPSIVVLPIRNLSGGERWDRLARGLTEDVTTALARNHWLFVIAAKTAYSRAAAGKDTRDIAQELGVRFALEGSLQAEGEALRVNAMLIEAPAGRAVWSQRWDRNTGQVFEIQDTIVGEIDNAIGSVWNGAISVLYRSRAKRHPTNSLGADELYLLGSEIFQRFEEDSARQSRDYFERAVQIDPGYAKAWAKLSLVHARFYASAQTQEGREQAIAARRHATLQAHAADPDDPNTLLQMSWLHSLNGDADGSEKATRRAAAFAPSNADLLAEAAYAGSWRSPLGDDSVKWAQLALRLNPNPPAWYYMSLGLSAFYAGRYELALEGFAKAPPLTMRLLHEAAAQAHRGDLAAAQALARRVMEARPDFHAGTLVQNRGEWGNPQSRDRFLKGMLLAGLPE